MSRGLGPSTPPGYAPLEASIGMKTSLFGMDSPEKAIACCPGRNLTSLRELTVTLAKTVVFGDDTLAKSTKSGRNGTVKLEKSKLMYIKS